MASEKKSRSGVRAGGRSRALESPAGGPATSFPGASAGLNGWLESMNPYTAGSTGALSSRDEDPELWDYAQSIGGVPLVGGPGDVYQGVLLDGSAMGVPALRNVLTSSSLKLPLVVVNTLTGTSMEIYRRDGSVFSWEMHGAPHGPYRFPKQGYGGWYASGRTIRGQIRAVSNAATRFLAEGTPEWIASFNQ